MTVTDDILDDLFQGCAFTAFLEQAAACGGWPEPEPTRRLAFRLYEAALRERPRRPAAARPCRIECFTGGSRANTVPVRPLRPDGLR